MNVDAEEYIKHLTKLATWRSARIHELELFIETHGLEIPR